MWWVPAISQESFELAYQEIGVCLRIPGITDENADVKKLVQATLSSDSVGDWLMVIDNADDHDVLLGAADGDSKSARLRDYLPRSDRGAILFTTRSKKVADALTQSSVLELTDMGDAEAMQLLTRRLTKPALLDDRTAVQELLNMLTCLPLAIVQAAAFINNNDVSVRGYISLFRNADTETELFSERFDDPGRYEKLGSTIATTWHISFDQIRKQDPLAARYLSFMACINRVNIPQSLLPREGSLVQQIKALGTLTGYAFITERLQTVQESDGGRSFDMHRLVHMASVWWLDTHNEHAAWVDTAVARLEELVPYGGHENKDVWTTYLQHAIYVAGSYSVVGTEASVPLLDRIGRCQASLGQYSAAEMTHRKVLLLREAELGHEHPDTLINMTAVAAALASQGDYVKAEKMHREALKLHQKILGDKHPTTLTSLSHVAAALTSQGNYVEAEKMHLETLELRQKMLGDEHPDTLLSMNAVAAVLSGQGEHLKAEKMHRETLKLRQKVLGDKHPGTLTCMNNIAVALSCQGDHLRAEKMHRETLELRQKVLGDEHPDTLTSIANIAAALNGQGEHVKAEKMHREALKLQQKVLGNKHPDTLSSMGYLAYTLASQLCYDESRYLFEQACAAYNTVLGENHPSTRACHEQYRQMLASQEQDRVSIHSERPQSNIGMPASKRSIVSRGLAKIGIKRSEYHVK